MDNGNLLNAETIKNFLEEDAKGTLKE